LWSAGDPKDWRFAEAKGLDPLPVDQLDKDARSHNAPDLQMQLYLQGLLLGARSVWPPYVEVAVARALNNEAGPLEVSAQVVEQG
jgi:hypothetical protein